MSSLCRFPETLAALAAAALLMTGCAKKESASVDENWALDPGPSISAEVKAGGIDARYTAYFDGERIKRISEVRSAGAKGDYEFEGARLIRYQGTALLSHDTVELTLDLQGKVRESKGANNAEVSAIRNRASLLRSLALTKRTTQSHGGG